MNAADNAERNVLLMRQAFSAINTRSVDECALLLTEDFIINIAGVPDEMRGREVWKQGVHTMRAAFPDGRVEIEDIFGAGDKVALRMSFTGTHLGEFQGFAATGKTVAYKSHEFYRFAGDLVAEEWICSDRRRCSNRSARGHELARGRRA